MFQVYSVAEDMIRDLIEADSRSRQFKFQTNFMLRDEWSTVQKFTNAKEKEELPNELIEGS